MIINNIERTCSTNIGILLAKTNKMATKYPNILYNVFLTFHYNLWYVGLHFKI